MTTETRRQTITTVRDALPERDLRQCDECEALFAGEEGIAPAYQCGNCDAILIDERRCGDCNRFASRLDEPVCPECEASVASNVVSAVECEFCNEAKPVDALAEHLEEEHRDECIAAYLESVGIAS